MLRCYHQKCATVSITCGIVNKQFANVISIQSKLEIVLRKVRTVGCIWELQVSKIISERCSHYPNKNVFSDRRNILYDKSASFRCDGRLFHSLQCIPVSVPNTDGITTAISYLLRVQQLQMLYRRRCCMSASQHMFGSLWNVVVTHKHQRQDGSRQLSTMAKCQTATDERASQPWRRRSGVPAANVADGAPTLYMNVEYQSPDGRRRSEPTATGSSVLPTCR